MIFFRLLIGVIGLIILLLNRVHAGGGYINMREFWSARRRIRCIWRQLYVFELYGKSTWICKRISMSLSTSVCYVLFRRFVNENRLRLWNEHGRMCSSTIRRQSYDSSRRIRGCVSIIRKWISLAFAVTLYVLVIVILWRRRPYSSHGRTKYHRNNNDADIFPWKRIQRKYLYAWCFLGRNMHVFEKIYFPDEFCERKCRQY